MMDDKKLQDAKLTEMESAEVVGGNSKKSNAKPTTTKCSECLKGTNLGVVVNTSYIYKAIGSTRTCCINGHVFDNGVYSHFSMQDVATWFNEHRS